MDIEAGEKTLLMASGGVIFFCILSVVIFVTGINIMLFYICAIVAILLGFYLSYNLSRNQSEQKSDKKKK